MRKYEVFFLREANVLSEIVGAARFTSITVPSRAASTTVTFYDTYDRVICMFTNVVKVNSKREIK